MQTVPVEIALFLVALVVGVICGAAVAARLGVPAPLLLLLMGVVATFLPGVPEIHLEPDIVLLGLLPPLLYSAAISTSLVDIAANRWVIGLLSVGLVLFTTAGVGAVVHALVPVSWPIAFAIGAVVAPPDAVAAVAIGRRIGLPRPIVTILEGESLLNDATALVSLRTAIAAASVSVEATDAGLDFLIASVGGAVIGFVVFVVVAQVRKRVTDPVLDTAVSLVAPFLSYLPAEAVHASGVIAVVTTGLLLGHRAPVIQTAQARIADSINWRTLGFLLENTVFLLIGLQARWIVEDVLGSELPASRIALACGGALVATVLLRIAWVFLTRLLVFRRGLLRSDAPWSYTFILGWAGMRGVVTLAAAFVIPEGTEHRPVLLMIAFTVVAGTLFGQGLTLPWFARLLAVPAPDPAEDALARAALLQQASKAGYEALERLEFDDPHDVTAVVRNRVEQRNNASWERLSTTTEEESPSDLYTRVRLAMIEAERHRVLEVRSSGEVDSEIIRQVLATLDVEESMLEVASDSSEEIRASAPRTTGPGGTCEDLHEAGPALMLDRDALDCAECVAMGSRWVALRRCMECGLVACCDSSPNRHASAHFRDTTHPVMQSAEDGESWRWCFVHHLTG